MEGFRERQVCQLAVKEDRDLQARCSTLETHEILPKSSTKLAPRALSLTIGCVIGSIPERPEPLGKFPSGCQM